MRWNPHLIPPILDTVNEEKISFDAYNESDVLKQAAEKGFHWLKDSNCFIRLYGWNPNYKGCSLALL